MKSFGKTEKERRINVNAKGTFFIKNFMNFVLAKVDKSLYKRHDISHLSFMPYMQAVCWQS